MPKFSNMPQKPMTIDSLAVIIKESFDHVEARFDNVEARLDNVDERLKAVEKEVSVMKMDLDHVRRTVDQIQSDIGEIKDNLTIAQRLERLEDAVFNFILKRKQFIK